MAATRNGSASHPDPFDGIRAFADAAYPGLPKTVDAVATAKNASVEVIRGGPFPSIAKNQVNVPAYFSSQEANQLIAEAVAHARATAGHSDRFQSDINPQTAFASVLLMPKEEFGKWLEHDGRVRAYSDSELGSLFGVSAGLVALRRTLFQQGY